jgi:methanethiol S-methyltransferase
MERVMGAVAVLYGIVAYAVFLGTLLYAIGFVGNFVVPKSIDFGSPAGAGAGTLVEALVVNMLLMGLFAVQHSVMARPAFKRWWTRLVPPAMERSTYVLLASLALILLFAQWRPIAAPIWSVSDPIAATGLVAISLLGWGVLVISTFLIDHFELFGLKQVFARLARRPMPAPVFKTPFFYRHIRHPIYLGFLLAFWATPTMTAGHLLFAAVTSAYILLGIWFEERDLIELFGDKYRNYRAQVGMFVPRLGRRFGSRRTGEAHDAPTRP